MRRLIVLLVVLAAIGAAVAGYFYARVDERFQGFESAEQYVEIPQGAGSQTIGRALVQAGVVRDEWTFRLAVYLTGTARELKAGEYRFAGPSSPKDVARRLARGDVYLRPITFPEGLTIKEMARLFESRGFGTAGAFTKAASNTGPIRAIDAKADDLEGYLFPETYNLPRRADANLLVAQMTSRFLGVFDEALRREAEAQSRTVREVVTLASLVEKETAKAEERPIVAAVYALEKAGKYDGNLNRENLRFDSPYNTYRYAGLPPGPIAAPGRASIEAVLRPARVDYLYFVSRNDGSHVFATTLAEHNRNVREWQKLFFKEKGSR
jgi:UPF0755 protein